MNSQGGEFAPASDPEERTPEQRRLDEAVARFLEADAAGRPLDRRQLTADYADLAEQLEAFFAEHDRLLRVAEPWERPPAEESADAGRRRGGRTLDWRTLTANGQPAFSLPDEPVTAIGRGTRLEGRLFGDYELLEEIGRGGMGVVCKARQVSLNRVVALKMLRSGLLARREELERFRGEAEAAAKLQHPNIVQIYEVAEHRGQPYFSMQYVEGKSLAQLLQEALPTPKRAAQYVRQIAGAIEHAHQHGVLHRDLKPSNVLIDAAGQAKVTDFGLAKQMESNADLTVSGQLLGTPSYMSPEQAGGRRHEVGATSDVYSLGAVLYELLTGQPPFRGKTKLETLLQVRENDPILPRRLNPQTPREIEMICLKCLEKDPRHRYPTAQALADDLGRYLQGDSISLSSLNLFERLVRALERGHHDVEFRAWSRMLFWLAGIICIAHCLVFLIARGGPPYSAARLGAIRGGEFTGMGVVFWLFRRDWYPPRGGPARQLWALWLAYIAGSLVMALVWRAWLPSVDHLMLYPQLAVLSSIGFVMMGSSYWGYCYLIGAAFLLLALLMPWNLSYAPLVFGLAWGASLTALGGHLRKLAEEP